MSAHMAEKITIIHGQAEDGCQETKAEWQFKRRGGPKQTIMAIDTTTQDLLMECPEDMAELLTGDYGVHFGQVLHSDFKVEDPHLAIMLDECQIKGLEMESFHMLETVKQWNAQTNEDVRLTICKAVSDHGEKNMNKLRNHQGNR